MTEKKITIGKGKKKKNVPKSYVPKELSKEDKKKQIKSIVEKKKRPKVDFKSKTSPYIEQFKKKYNRPITDTEFIDKNILKKEGQRQIIAKGMAAYYTAGSRPNQSPQSWSRARLASVIVGGPARRIDIKIWNKYKV